MTNVHAFPTAALIDPLVEEKVLGALVAHPEAWARVGGVLQPEHFDHAQRRGLFKVIAAIAKRDGAVNALAVRAALELDDDGRSTWRDRAVLDLIDCAPFDVAEVDGLAASLIEMWARRRLTGAAQWIEAEASRAYRSPYDVARELAVSLEDVIATGRSAKTTQISLGDAAESFLADIDSELRASTFITTGLPDLDRILGGYVGGRLVIMSGRPGMGKSTLAPASARLAAKATGTGVFFASMEMTDDELLARFLTDVSYRREEPIEYRAVLDHMKGRQRLDDRSRERLRSILPAVKALAVTLDKQPRLAVEELQARARRKAQALEREGKRLGLVIVDHLGLLQPSAKLEHNATRAIGENAARLKELAKELDVCVVALCQLNRGVESREERRPTLADLRQSGEIEEHADQVLMLYREAYYLARMQEQTKDAERAVALQEQLTRAQHELEILVAKNRHGPVGSVRAWVDMGSCVVRPATFGGWER